MRRLLAATALLTMLLVPVGAAVSAEGPNTGSTTRISVATGGIQSNNSSYFPAVSADGTTIFYESYADNLVPDDTNNSQDVFAYDTTTGTTTRISVASDGTQANHWSGAPAVSADGTTIVYQSWADNLVPGDTNGATDIFAYDTATGATTRVSVASNGTQGNRDSGGVLAPAVSADGTTIVYYSEADNLVPSDTNDSSDIFAYDTTTGATTRVSVASDGTQANGGSGAPAISADGTTIVYQSVADNLVPDDTSWFADLFAYDTTTGATTRVSVASDGTQADNWSTDPAVSADGTTIVYRSVADNLVPDDTNNATDIFAYDTTTGTTTRISVASDGTQADHWSYAPAVSADGTTIVYDSFADNLVPDDTNNAEDVFLTRLGYGRFVDDDTSIFEKDIESLAASDITKGCNPPANDQYCPTGVVTRGQMAAFLARALNLPATSHDYFQDDNNSIFEDPINQLAAAGITKGCNPPDNTHFCPTSNVTRGQLAAFLVRALGYTDDGGGNLFTDDDGSLFEADIDKLATAGVTRGCNPPDNTHFCPTSNVTRGQMAAFLHRALG